MSWWERGGNIKGKTREQVHVLVAKNRSRMRQLFCACLFFTFAQWQPIRQTRSDNNYKIHFLLHKLGGLGVSCARHGVEKVFFCSGSVGGIFVCLGWKEKCWMNIFVLGVGGKVNIFVLGGTRWSVGADTSAQEAVVSPPRWSHASAMPSTNTL